MITIYPQFPLLYQTNHKLLHKLRACMGNRCHVEPRGQGASNPLSFKSRGHHSCNFVQLIRNPKFNFVMTWVIFDSSKCFFVLSFLKASCN